MNAVYELESIEPGSHTCLLYESLDEKWALVAAWFASGLKQGHQCLYYDSAESIKALTEYCTEHAPDILPHIFSGHLILAPVESIIENPTAPQPASRKNSTMRIAVEMSGFLVNGGNIEQLARHAADYDKRARDLTRSFLVCLYDLNRFTPENMGRVVQTHPRIYWKGKLLQNDFYLPAEGLSSYTAGEDFFRHCLRQLDNQQEKQNKLEQTEHMYRTIFNAVGVATCMIDGKGVITLVNGHWEQLFDYDKQEVEGRKHFSYFLHPEEKMKVERYFKLRPLGTGVVPAQYQTRIVTKAGETRTVLFSARMILSSTSRIASAVDISEHNRVLQELAASERRYRALFENSMVAVLEVDYSRVKKILDDIKRKGIRNFRAYFASHPDELSRCFQSTRIISANQALLDIWEAESLENILNVTRPVLEKGKALDLAPSDTIIRLAQGQTRFSKEEVLRTITGKSKHIRTNVTVLPGHEHTLSRVYIDFVDITELKNTTQELQKYRDQLEDLVRERTEELEQEIEKSRQLAEKNTGLYQKEMQLREQLENVINERAKFTRYLVHELKTPLTPMMGSTNLLLDQVKGTHLERLALNISRGAQSLNKRINDLLDLVRGEIGVLKLIKNWVDMVNLINSVVNYMIIEFERRNQAVKLKIEENLPPVWGDSERLRQVLINLLDNASKFTPEGGIIRISACKKADTLVVKVQNPGQVIRKEFRGTIFGGELKSRTQVTSGDPGADMGIGLPLCKLLVEMHGGSIWLETKPGKGNAFIFSLPLKDDYSVRG